MLKEDCIVFIMKEKTRGAIPGLEPGLRTPEARIIPLDHIAI